MMLLQRQANVYLLVPTRDQETQFIVFLAVGFVLKSIQMLHMIICQVTVDIFFIDWERPRGNKGPSNDAKQKGPQESPVSIWRTYFVANEWNEIQTTRKINQIFQIFAVVFFLTVVGFQNMATADPRSDLIKQSDMYYSGDSRIFRFAIAALVYLLVGKWYM